MMVRRMKRILEIGNWPPPVCSWSMSLVGLRKELEARGWECRVMNLNENRRVLHPDYIDIQSGWDYVRKLVRCVREGCAVHVRVNGEAVKGYLVAFLALLAARLGRRPALLTYGGGHQQTYFPAPRFSFTLRFPSTRYDGGASSFIPPFGTGASTAAQFPFLMQRALS